MKGNLMNRDFTLTKYQELCEAISDSNYIPMTVEKFLKTDVINDKIIILRHDVDMRPIHALQIAKIEIEFEIKSTYYFRMIKEVFHRDIIEQIYSLGHEIGYHYEVLDKAKGDFKIAIKIFDQELEAFRRISDIRTICMHGNPRTPWNSRDIWKFYDFAKYNILGEAYLSINFNKLAYISDSARTWNHKYKVKDIVEGSNGYILPRIKSTDEIIDLIENEQYDRLYILTHPDEWTNNSAIWMWDIVRQSFRNQAKLMVKWWFEWIKEIK